MNERILIAGFGGQGALTAGQLIASLYLNRGVNVTWMPSYGAEMRGGTANCSVIASDGVIGSPIVSANAGIVMALNSPSLDKFEPVAAPGGTVILNTSIVTRGLKRGDVKSIKIDASNIAVNELKNIKVANMVMLGAYLTLHPEFTDDEIERVLNDRFGAKAAALIPLNMKAIASGKANAAR
ncbi:MAG: 2-oxoacid:acceptor oxidoreductase family protein [Defluviitaleaceae bacterium]|nr:2-oxoacid:acceptor oxidoreductase family protein [Defluviitaleaceae bacterium]MCL2835154.1 2-oxoacid:acceptor oxidoreductase family protein [Defluviitaleaceae bacterium]